MSPFTSPRSSYWPLARPIGATLILRVTEPCLPTSRTACTTWLSNSDSSDCVRPSRSSLTVCWNRSGLHCESGGVPGMFVLLNCSCRRNNQENSPKKRLCQRKMQHFKSRNFVVDFCSFVIRSGSLCGNAN